MKRLFLAALSSSALAGEPASIDLRSVPFNQVAQLVYSEIIKTPYLLAPEVVADVRPVSVRFKAGDGDFKALWNRILQSVGYEAAKAGGLDHVRPVSAVPVDVFAYKPKYRDASFLNQALMPFIGQSVASKPLLPVAGDVKASGPVPAESAAAVLETKADLVVVRGSLADITLAKRLIEQLDTPLANVHIEAALVEVGRSKREGSAVQAIFKLLDGKLSLAIGSGGPALENFVQIKTGSVDAVLSAISGDSRFKVVSTPSVRIQSGQSARLMVGQDVPVLGKVVIENGVSSQSVDYRSSGAILEITPKVRGAVVDVDVSQQLSNFVKTESGVNNSPTLTKRELKTALGVASGDVVVLGGLRDSKTSSGNTGLPWLPLWAHAITDESADSELVLIMRVSSDSL